VFQLIVTTSLITQANIIKQSIIFILQSSVSHHPF